MLEGIYPVLNTNVIHALRVLGYGDDPVIVETNLPADCATSFAFRNIATPDAG